MDIIFFFLGEKMEANFVHDNCNFYILKECVIVCRFGFGEDNIISLINYDDYPIISDVLKKYHNDYFIVNKNNIKFNLNCNKSEKYKYKWLSKNYNSITYDYDKIKETFREINKEIIEKYWHPDNIDAWIGEIEE
jgi:hypothetical protein